MCPVHRVSRLEGHDTFPATLCKELARLRWRIAVLGKGLILQCDHPYWSTQEHIALLIHHLHTWMPIIQRAVDLARLKPSIVAVLF